MEFIVTGGVWYTVPILVMGIAAIILIAIATLRTIRKKTIHGMIADTILFLGFISLAWGIFGQITGMFQAAGAIVQAGDISPNLIWAGFKVSLIPVIMGFVVLFISAIGWFLLRWMSATKK